MPDDWKEAFAEDRAAGIIGDGEYHPPDLREVVVKFVDDAGAQITALITDEKVAKALEMIVANLQGVEWPDELQQWVHGHPKYNPNPYRE